MPLMQRRIRVLDAPVDAVDMDSALALVDFWVQRGREPACILAMNPEKVDTLGRDPHLRRFFEQASLIVPDGIGIVWAARLLLRLPLRRLAGADLMQAICAQAATAGYGIFLYGATGDVNRRAGDELRRRYSAIRIVGQAPGYLKPAQAGSLVQQINESGADILFVGLGSPRQEHWIRDHLPDLKVKICQGIGGTLDTIAGVRRRAPKLLREAGLEWLYRLMSQPSRWRRQFALVHFALAVLRRLWRRDFQS